MQRQSGFFPHSKVLYNHDIDNQFDLSFDVTKDLYSVTVCVVRIKLLGYLLCATGSPESNRSFYKVVVFPDITDARMDAKL